MNKINIVGLGPGNPDYILPEVTKIIKKSDILIGGKRNLESVDTKSKKTIEITNNLSEILEFIKKNIDNRQITIVASGDIGFCSILGFLKKHFDTDNFNIVPGISVFQYFFAKIGKTYEDAFLGSLHGKDFDLLEKLTQYKKIFLLTDEKHSYKYIAKILCDNNLSEKIIYLGANLSYPDETIIKEKAKYILDKDFSFKLYAVIIDDE
ncbi:MAG: precorrin-6y C5,15-methyltransferase (decarboxylating) subunit CbiE [Spirochaetes bacterium GWD1_27_9]|nr:MAG: precorrin-6y C5,15-methyltransferase (decarboxylating) subunit CbiE [Spirochaetes bacterium GWB1_27_13]OHD27225.1 MAG: precorrin-6y C5,15-methyltransferase (decarboxylating) subunit CbiE [Spirochaetes bacterium GWC1_27_15]OHD39595.1 MAG: precorrin-6y C5,15-methyltransferase (decarboxylating) subunit CbiE [Spirochaetes bacterium GWD1_27_9]